MVEHLEILFAIAVLNHVSALGFPVVVQVAQVVTDGRSGGSVVDEISGDGYLDVTVGLAGRGDHRMAVQPVEIAAELTAEGLRRRPRQWCADERGARHGGGDHRSGNPSGYPPGEEFRNPHDYLSGGLQVLELAR
ncbi:Uncharacterised protein [Mycobacteroides abscessus subsp. abscessus]|nr:Uncharacterised protein [Mycobacteroides abscessus subsp. abscessus]